MSRKDIMNDGVQRKEKRESVRRRTGGRERETGQEVIRMTKEKENQRRFGGGRE